MQKTAMNEKDILRRHATHAYALTDADRAEILAAFAADSAVDFLLTAVRTDSSRFPSS